MNTDWKKLKLSSSGLPTWDSFIPYVLEVLKNGEETTRKVIVDRVLDHIELPTHFDSPVASHYKKTMDFKKIP